MRLYHATSPENAEAILRDGFRDTWAGLSDTGDEVRGVWFTSDPSGESDHLDAVVIAVDVPDSIANSIANFTLSGEPVHYGAIPAQVVNRFKREALETR